MKRMVAMKDTEDAIMIHIDILTEGIDLPSITGVMPFRELNTLKLLQTIGRSARLLMTDRQRLYSGQTKPKDWAHYVKPYCWLILPEHFSSLGNSGAMKDALRTIINTYKVPVAEYVVTEKFITPPKPDIDPVTDPDQPNRKDKESNLIHTIEELMIEEFDRLPDKLGVLKRAFGATS